MGLSACALLGLLMGLVFPGSAVTGIPIHPNRSRDAIPHPTRISFFAHSGTAP
jgi:hypothetical protein